MLKTTYIQGRIRAFAILGRSRGLRYHRIRPIHTFLNCGEQDR